MSMAESIADVSRKLPPTPRDWQAYCLVKIQLQTTRETAEQLHISQTRVCQLIERVVEFLNDVAPGDESPEARSRRVYIAESVAAERVDHLYGQALRSFQASVGPQAIVRETPSDFGPPRTSTTIRTSAGDVRMLAAAARLALIGGKLPVNTLLPMLPDEIADEIDSEEETSPPVEDCSDLRAEPAVAMTHPQPATGSTETPATSCDTEPVTESLRKITAARPVQERADKRERAILPPHQQRQREAFFNPA